MSGLLKDCWILISASAVTLLSYVLVKVYEEDLASNSLKRETYFQIILDSLLYYAQT